jgi:sarcosine oxidase subunit beta
LLICAGAWSDRLAARFGETVPLVTRAPTMSVTEPVPYAMPLSIGVSTPLESEAVYFRQIPRGNVVIGGSTRGRSHDERRAQVVREKRSASCSRSGGWRRQRAVPRHSRLERSGRLYA